jgi:hypothetical protein
MDVWINDWRSFSPAAPRERKPHATLSPNVFRGQWSHVSKAATAAGPPGPLDTCAAASHMSPPVGPITIASQSAYWSIER